MIFIFYVILNLRPYHANQGHWPIFYAGLEELWFGITFDPLEEALIWEPTCPVTAVAGLCEKKEDGVCVDLPDSSRNVTKDKVKNTEHYYTYWHKNTS